MILRCYQCGCFFREDGRAEANPTEDICFTCHQCRDKQVENPANGTVRCEQCGSVLTARPPHGICLGCEMLLSRPPRPGGYQFHFDPGEEYARAGERPYTETLLKQVQAIREIQAMREIEALFPLRMVNLRETVREIAGSVRPPEKKLKPVEYERAIEI